MEMKSSSLLQVWSALPRESAIAYFGEENLLFGARIQISDFRAFTEDERLEALNNVIQSKHSLVIAPSTCGSFVPVSQMATDELIFSATFKPKIESCPIIDKEIKPVFDELTSLLQDSDPAVSAQALEDIQDMVMDQTFRQISRGNIKYFFLYQDDLMDCMVMILGNRQALSFDSKKIKALQNKVDAVLKATSAPDKTSKAPAKSPAKKRTSKPKRKQSSSSSESESSDSESSDDSSNDSGRSTPVFPRKSPASLSHAEELDAARQALIVAQQKLAELSARAAEPAQTSGPVLKVPPSPVVALMSTMNATHNALSIPKKSQMIAKADRKLKPDKKQRKAARKAARSARHAHKKHSKKHVKKSKKSRRARSSSSSESKSSPSDSDSESKSDSTPQKDDHTHQV